MNTLTCKEDSEEESTNERQIRAGKKPSTELETLQSNAPDEDSDEVPKAPLSLASPILGKKDQPQLPFLSTSGSRMRLTSGSSSSSGGRKVPPTGDSGVYREGPSRDTTRVCNQQKKKG